MFCHGVLLLSHYVVVPAHCVVAATKLAHFHLRHRGRSVKINPQSVLVHPEFRLISYDKRDLLYHDIAIFPIRNITTTPRHTRRRSRRNISLAALDLNLAERRTLSVRRSEYFLSQTGGQCDPAGLPAGQLCLTRPASNASRSVLRSVQARHYLGRLELLDPGQGYYRAACLQTSGLAVLDTTSHHCRLEALVLRSTCDLNTIVALDLRFYRDWLRSAILTDILKHRELRRRRNTPTRGLFLQELRNSKSCPPLAGKDVQRLARQTNLATSGRTVVQKPPEFGSLPEDLRVITDCGVEIRLEAGVIQSPIHYRDVQNYSELLGLLQQDYKYRPNQQCEWLITSPRRDQKVGLRFQYFDLHPQYDRLEVEGEAVLEEARPDVASFRGGQQPRTIISGSRLVH